jgi:Tfp pilus assembly protein PilV
MSNLSTGAIIGIAAAVLVAVGVFSYGGMSSYNNNQAFNQQQEDRSWLANDMSERIGGRKTKRRKLRKNASKKR